MGRQYVSWLKELGYEVFTVDIDPTRQANYINHTEAINYKSYDIIYIGTPNCTHEPIAKDVVNKTKILIVEKPGFVNSQSWRTFVEENPQTRISMVKNNQYRLELSGFKDLLKISYRINVVWSRKSGIPNSGWFKQKEKAFGGVSRDLMTHLLSYYTALTNYKNGTIISAETIDYHNTGIDDFCSITIKNSDIVWTFTANWKNDKEDCHHIEFDFGDSTAKFELGDYVTAFGGCPASPYMNMIQSTVSNIDNNEYWQNQKEQDIWIHEQIENL